MSVGSAFGCAFEAAWTAEKRPRIAGFELISVLSFGGSGSRYLPFGPIRFGSQS